jgi:hypothetical protein
MRAESIARDDSLPILEKLPQHVEEGRTSTAIAHVVGDEVLDDIFVLGKVVLQAEARFEIG